MAPSPQHIELLATTNWLVELLTLNILDLRLLTSCWTTLASTSPKFSVYVPSEDCGLLMKEIIFILTTEITRRIKDNALTNHEIL
jgi:hypothetical protein